MFVRVKRVGDYAYLQIVENRREGKKTRQRVVATLGRLDEMQAKGEVDVLLKSLGRFGERVKVQEAYQEGRLEGLSKRSIGPQMVFGRLWDELGLPGILGGLLSKRAFEFDVERAVFLTVLHRLFESGSDRQGMRWWKSGVWVKDAEGLSLHHMYRAMGWLGETKDEIEQGLHWAGFDLFAELSLVFFDTTSLYFEGNGGETLGKMGHSKDRRGDHHQVVVGALLTGEGRPISCEVAPGNRTDVKALLPMVDAARERFGLNRVCWVADRGMFSREIITGLEEGMEYILGTRMRRLKEVREAVLSRAGRYRAVQDNLMVKEVRVRDHRYVVCINPIQAEKDRADREAILEALEEQVKRDPKSLVKNRGYRRFLKVQGEALSVDREKAAREERFDGKFVLRTNTSLPAEEVALQYKRLWTVEYFFRLSKDLLETRPVYHRCDDTIRGHIFVSFLALLLRYELLTRLEAKGYNLEWNDVIRDLASLTEVDVRLNDKRYILRLPLEGVSGKVFQAAGVAIPPPVKEA